MTQNVDFEEFIQIAKGKIIHDLIDLDKEIDAFNEELKSRKRREEK